LSSQAINESDVIGVPIGTLDTIGVDGSVLPSGALTYALVDGPGSDDNSRFRIVNSQLQANAVVDRESRGQLRVRIRVTNAAGRSLEKAFTITVNDLPNPVATGALATPAVAWGSPAQAVDLSVGFDDPLSSGLVATFQLAPVEIASNTLGTIGSGQVRVVLYDQPGQGAPLTTANLQAYVNANRYNGTFLHRSVPGFVLQGGGFNLLQTPTGAEIQPVTTFPAVRNEFSAARSNLRGTIAMAKIGSDPNSATSQWFWSLADNSAILNPQNGGFTVFGRVLDSSDLATLDALAAIPVTDQTLALRDGAFGELPLSNRQLRIDNLLRFSSITIDARPELAYALIGNSAPELLSATLDGTRLQLRALANLTREVSLTLRATSLLGETLDQTLRVQLRRKSSNQATIRSLNDALGNATPTLGRPTLAGSLASPLQPDERVRLFANGASLGLATTAPGALGWSFQPEAPLTPGADGAVRLEARLETLEGVAGESSPSWSLGLGSEVRIDAPGSELLRVGEARPVVVRPTPIGTWGPGFSAWNGGSITAAGQRLPGTGQTVRLAGLRRYGITLRSAPQSQVIFDLGDGDHAFVLHDSWTPQTGELPAQSDSLGRQTAPRFDQLTTLRLGNGTVGGTTVVDLTSPDFLTGAITVVAGNTVGSRQVIWGSAADDTVIGGAADLVIAGSGGRNTFQLGSGADRLQYVAGVGATDRVTGFQPAVDRLELWGLPPGSPPELTLQSVGGDTLLTWDNNRVTFSGLTLPVPAPGTLPSWVVVM
ncbi:MAG: peptidylprolyl isomerase, partial [Cyanobacteriota bacterium]|nr:peptidylprolyl isomerase [Cyanobacteriota bacterium]